MNAENSNLVPTEDAPKPIRYQRPGKLGGALLLWLLGVPIPLIILFFLIKGCMT